MYKTDPSEKKNLFCGLTCRTRSSADAFEITCSTTKKKACDVKKISRVGKRLVAVGGGGGGAGVLPRYCDIVWVWVCA